jgi:malate synthase
MTTLIARERLLIAPELVDFIEQEVLPGLPVSVSEFWRGFSALLHTHTPRNQALLAERTRLQTAIDAWHRANPGPIQDAAAYRTFLESIGYLQPDPGAIQILTERVDPEINVQAGPQLVVPVMNARYALNAANARYGSLYDALYGSDVIANDDGAAPGLDFNPIRAARVVAYAKQFLDAIAPLNHGSHATAKAYAIVDQQLHITLTDERVTTLQNPASCSGFCGDATSPTAIVLTHHHLHVLIHIERAHPVGQRDAAGVKDVQLEAALTTILDLEDSIAAVDGADKVAAYRNLLGLFKGSLSERVPKGSTFIERRLSADIPYHDLAHKPRALKARALLFMRNVGHLMTTPAVMLLSQAGPQPAPEGLVDALLTSAIAQHDLLGHSALQNTTAGSIYIVKPKMHGADEVAFCGEVLSAVEALLSLAPNTIKLGIMDEERRTSLNLRACLAAARERVVFINTGFLDRTGDEIHTSMWAGPMVRKQDMRTSAWLNAYEKLNVWTGLSCGLKGRAQIGKGMWAMPDRMAQMLAQKIAHPQAGANTAWVPSPTAATLHALHYHEIDVATVQTKLIQNLAREPVDAWRADLLSVPVAANPNWSAAEIQAEIDNNVQGILGYVVRWVEHGVGCSKVPDIHNIGLMEDRATLRISSQLLANWLAHGIIDAAQVNASFTRMAAIVDAQNAADPNYQPMHNRLSDSPAYQAALALVFNGCDEPSGYTEPLLHAWRLRAKAATAAAG